MSTPAQVAANVRCTQFLDADAQLCAPLPEFARDTETLRQLYRRMVETRIFDKKALALQRAGQLSGYTAFLGREAIVAAVAAALRADDILVGSDHESTLQALSGISLLDVLRHWGAVPQPAPASTGRSLARAIEIAGALKRDEPARVVLAPGDDSLFDGDALAAQLSPGREQALPLIIVIPTVAQHAQTPLAARAVAIERVDGNDVIAMCDALQRGAAHARRGDGPRLIAATICPLVEWRPNGDVGMTRSQTEIRAAWEQCPIKRLKRHLESRRLWTIDDEEALLLTAGEQANAAATVLRAAAR